MDFRTFFFTNIVSVAVFTACVSLVAWNNRAVTGMKWLAGGLIAGLLKLSLQGLDGIVPRVLSAMASSELYLISFTLQLVGLRWFVDRRPLRLRWLFAALALALAVYTAMYLRGVPYSGNVINIPFVVACGASAVILLRYGDGPFRTVSRVTAAVAGAQGMVAAYRAVLTNSHLYARPWEPQFRNTDPHWLYSLAGMAFLSTCMVMCSLWLMVTELERELEVQARTDPLTGVLNRRAMEEAGFRETARSLRNGSPLCMMVLDIDHFKKINDRWGHAAGDRALQAMVHRLRAVLRSSDLLARTGGEEFTVLLPDTDPSGSFVIAERVRQSIESLEVPFADGIIRFTVSAGVAQFVPSLGGWEVMMQRADAAMYRAKEHGRNRVASDVQQELTQSHSFFREEPNSFFASTEGLGWLPAEGRQRADPRRKKCPV